MRIPRVDAQGLQVAESDQRESELRTLAGLLGGYRTRLLEAGFSEKEAFALIERLHQRALQPRVDRRWEPRFYSEDDDE